MPTNIEDGAAERAVFDYLSDRNGWEREAWNLSHSRRGTTHWSEVNATIRAGYAALLERHCAPRVIALRLPPTYGKPPTVDPGGTRIVSVTHQRGAVKVMTEEDIGDDLGPTRYEYELVEVDGRLRLAERRGRVSGRRPVRDVW